MHLPGCCRAELDGATARADELASQGGALEAQLGEERARCAELAGAKSGAEASLADAQAALRACEEKLVAAEVRTFWVHAVMPAVGLCASAAVPGLLLHCCTWRLMLS